MCASQGAEAPSGDAGMVSQASGAGDGALATVAHPPSALQRVGGGGDGGGDGGDGGGDDEFAMLEEAEIKHMTVAKLKDALRSRQLSTGGRKGARVHRCGMHSSMSRHDACCATRATEHA